MSGFTSFIPKNFKALSKLQQTRSFSLHEYQSMELLKKYSVPTPNFEVVNTVDDAIKVSQTFKSDDVVVKAQVLSGGRGKGVFDSGFKGGVQLVNGPEECGKIAHQMLGKRLITKQSGPSGKPCDKLMIAERLFSRHEYYIAILLDRDSKSPVLIGSNRGGMDIEAVASEDPTAIIKKVLPLSEKLTATDVNFENFFEAMGIPQNLFKEAEICVRNMYRLFLEKDCTLLEINPLIETKDGKLMCVDAKINFDDNASFRQKDLWSKRDLAQEDSREVRAESFNLNYIGLDGSIGCLVNGAGLAMATMDIIKLHGGEPANFLDVGGGATAAQVTEAVRILGEDPKVKAILVNIFGGIMRCDIIAEGILQAVSKTKLEIPLVVRLQGTNVNEAKEMIRNSKLRVFNCDELDQAAAKAVILSKIMELAKSADLRPYVHENTRSRPIAEVKHETVQSVLRWETTREYWML